jgi:hypothetical protein
VSSPLVGGCVLTGLSVGAFAALYAVDPAVCVLVFWGLAVACLWRAARRRVSDLPATPPPEVVAPSGDVYAGESDRVARVVYSPEGVMCTIHMEREEVQL